MSGKSIKIACFIIYYLFISVVIYAQTENNKFSNIGVQNGMSANWITALYRDTNGFVWIGTKRGLNRFDGYNIKTFAAINSDTTSLASNIINCISEDSESNLWVGTAFGINIMNKNLNDFRQISLYDYNAFNCNDINYITDLLRTQAGEMYIGTHEGYFVYNKGQFTHHLIDSTDFTSDVNYVVSFAQDADSNIWVGTNTRSLIRLGNGNKAVHKYVLPDLYEGKYTSGLFYMLMDKNSKLWIGTQAGLYVFDVLKNEWDAELNQLLFEKIGNKVITGIEDDRDGNIWISTDGAGLYIFDTKKNTSSNIRHQIFNKNSLSSDGVYGLMIDKDDIVWVGTYKHGLDYFKRDKKKFLLMRHQPGSSNSLISNDVNCIIEDMDKNLWFGTNGVGISILNPENGNFRHITAQSGKPNGLSSNVVVSLLEDSNKNIWIGTYFGGLNKYNQATGEIEVFKHLTGDSTSISDDRIWSIAEDNKNNIWVGTLGGGLNLYNSSTGQFKTYSTTNSNIIGNYINHLYLDSKNRLWISASDGLSIYDEETDDFESFNNPQGRTGTNLFGILVSTFEDSRGWLWLCSSNGLIRFNYEEKSITVIDANNGLLSNPVNRILEDKHGNLWVSSSSGLTKIAFTNILSDGTFTATYTYYDETDGLQSNEFSETAALQTSKNQMLFGGINGINIFDPDEIKNNIEKPELLFLNFRIFNEIILPNQVFNNRVVLEKPIFKTNEVVLKYSENFFSIEFAALTFLSPDKNKYRYRLLGFDENWFDTDGNNNFATYTNLNNGDYVFQVIGANADGTWNTEGISMNITILPPIWKRWYAFIFYVGIISLALFILRSMILFRERLNVRLKHERIESQRIHDLDMLKIKFFTNISHEFRTPLSLILSPVEKLLPKYKNSPDEKYLKHIYLNSKKLLNMINQLLDFRKMDVKGLSYDPSHEDIIAFINEVVISFNDLSENKNISLRMATDIKELKMLFDKDKLEKILFNLLSNAFKYTPVNGLVLMEVSVESEPQQNESRIKQNLILKVKDNGVGIKKDKLDKIFTRFYQADNSSQVSEKGTGIGLSLVQEYVSIHKGHIEVESALGVGSCFTVTLPVEGEGNLIKQDRFQTMVLGEESHKPLPKVPIASVSVVPDSEKPLVLIAEDNHDLRVYLKENLSPFYRIIEAENGREAWPMLQKSMPDLVLSDIMMPEMDGIQFCKLAKTNHITCHIPFIFLTAKNTEQQELVGLEAGADDYISKPFNLNILEVKIKNLIQLKLNIRKILNTKLQIEPKDISITSLDEIFMEKALHIIENKLSVINFTVEDFSKEMGISRMHLYKKLVSLTGKPPHEFMRIFRLKRAAQLLQKSQLTISEVAYKVGYNDPKYFSKHFKNEFDILPSKYIKQFKN